MKNILFIVSASLFLLSCKSPQKTVSGSKLHQEISIGNDETVSNDQQISIVADEIIRRISNEKLIIDVKQLKYDTDKPSDSTGKYPVLSADYIRIYRNTDIEEKDSLKMIKDSISAFHSVDKSKTIITSKTETKEEKETELRNWQKILMIIGGVAVGSAIFMITIKNK